MKNKIFIAIFLILILLTNISCASYSTVTMSVVEEPICTIDIGNNSKFEKKLISKDLKNKEVTLQLQVINNEAVQKPTGELILVLDDSVSMENSTSSGKIRKNLVYNSAQTLISNLLKDNNQLKIGIVSFSTKTALDEGTIEDATLESALTNDVSQLTTAISNIKVDGARTDLQAGLKLAYQQFSSEDNNKYMIILTDGVPNVAINDTDYYSDTVIEKTKSELQSLQTNGVLLTTLLTGIDNANSIATPSEKTFGEIIQEIFGTQTTPNYGTFYYIEDDKIEETIQNDIYNSLVAKIKSYKDITVIDYFPTEIVKNFDFAYVSNPNIGNISTKIDTTTNSITWTISELAAGETATVQYKLKLKENFDSSIINKTLNTNQKVDITYTDTDGNSQTKTSDITPKIILQEPNIAPTALPKAGRNIIYALTGIMIIAFVIFSVLKFIQIKNKMN